MGGVASAKISSIWTRSKFCSITRLCTENTLDAIFATGLSGRKTTDWFTWQNTTGSEGFNVISVEMTTREQEI